MRPTHDKVIVSEIKHRNIKGYLRALCSYYVCVSLLFLQRISLIGPFLRLPEVLGTTELVVSISVDVRGNTTALLLGQIMFPCISFDC